MPDLSQAVQYMRRITASVLDPEQGKMPTNLADMCLGFDLIDRALSAGLPFPDEWMGNRRAPKGLMYAVHATYEREVPNVGTRSGQVPTFYLHPNVQGILSEEHAAKVAQDILRAGTDPTDNVTFHVSAYEV